VPGQTYKYLGHSPLGFPDYCDMATGRMLIAEPGESYEIRAVNQGAPVPPMTGGGNRRTSGPVRSRHPQRAPGPCCAASRA
jgi:hypothetical protein